MEMSQAERQVMRALWANPGSRSQEIIALLEGDFDWKPATIKTMLNRLKDKELLEMVKEDDGKFHYYPLLSEQAQLQKDGRQVLANICARKRGDFLTKLLAETPLSKDDLETLQQLITQKVQDAPDVIPCDCKPGQCNCGHACH